MNKVKKLFKQAGWWILYLFGYVVILMLLNYTKLFTYSTLVKFNYICIALILLASGILAGRSCEKKAYIRGIELSGIIVLVLFLLNIIFIRSFNLKTFMYYLLIIVSFTIGSMIGINLKKTRK